MRELPILWQRLVTQGATCPRCGSTQRAIEAAVARLEPALQALGMRPVLETQVIDEDAFRAGRLSARHYGELLVPEESRYVQHVKQGGGQAGEAVYYTLV